MIGWCFKELRLKLTLAKVGFKVEEEFDTVIGLKFAQNYTFSVRRVAEESEDKANSAYNYVEVEAEVGKNGIC